MQITIRSTERLTTLDGVRCRVWEGATPAGVPVTVFVHRVAVREDRDAAELERELAALLPPLGEV